MKSGVITIELKYLVAFSALPFAIFIGLTRPMFLFLTCVLVLPLQTLGGGIEIGIATLTVYDALVMLLFVCFFFRVLFGLEKLSFSIFNLLVFFWLMVNIIAVFILNYDMIGAVNRFRYMFAIPLALYILTYHLLNSRHRQIQLIYAQVLGISILALDGIYEFSTTGTRIYTLLNSGISAAILFSWCTLLCIYLIKDTNKKIFKILFIFVFVINLTACVLTGTRIVIVLLFLTLIIIFLNLYKNKATLIGAIMALCLAGSVFFSFYVASHNLGYRQAKDKTSKKLERITDKQHYKQDIAGRGAFWHEILRRSRGHMLFGYGFSGFRYLHDKYNFPVFHAHNLFFDILIRTGFCGMCFFFLVIIKFIHIFIRGSRLVENYSDQLFLCISFLGVFIIIGNGITNNIFTLVASSVFWLLIAQTVSFARIVATEAEIKKSNVPEMMTISENFKKINC